MTDHSRQIAQLREGLGDAHHMSDEYLARYLAADLLEAHDDTGISLDCWVAAREFVERHVGFEIEENGA